VRRRAFAPVPTPHSCQPRRSQPGQTDSAEALSHLGILLLDQALGPDATHTVITDAT
jgi:hypothetical protein